MKEKFFKGCLLQLLMKKEVADWIAKAEADFRKAKILSENKEFDGATFYSQQTAEKALKAVCIFRGLGLIKTHDLSNLGRMVKLPSELLKKAILLNLFYTSSRYPLGDEEQEISNEESASESLIYAEEILKWCKQQIKI